MIFSSLSLVPAAPAPWSVEEREECFIVQDATSQPLTDEGTKLLRELLILHFAKLSECGHHNGV